MKICSKSSQFTYSKAEHDPFLTSEHTDLDIQIISENTYHLMYKSVFFTANDGHFSTSFPGACLDTYICRPGEFCYNKKKSGFGGIVIFSLYDNKCP